MPRTGLLRRHGGRHVGVTGCPEGHPGTSDRALWRALIDKAAAIGAGGLDGDLITRFGFDADPVLDRLEALRARACACPSASASPDRPACADCWTTPPGSASPPAPPPPASTASRRPAPAVLDGSEAASALRASKE